MGIFRFNEISEEEWEGLRPPENPFLKKAFFSSLEDSVSIGGGSGWEPLLFKDPEGILFSFIKNHSYGEYIFDWEWARAYAQYQLPYYPKLTSMIPFTPAATSHFIMPGYNEKAMTRLLNSYQEYYLQGNFSSSHFLFLKEEEVPVFEKTGYMIRDSFQYHFLNEGYQSFEEYLQTMKGRKAKHIRHERVFPDLCIEKITKEQLSSEHALEMYRFYLSTIDDKNAIDYLKREFFMNIFENMKENVLYVRASQEGKPVAGALFFYDEERLYGRYWGSNKEVMNLHFELCYYQGIEFCIENKLKIFEAGAQGEHKISRGFRPVKTLSAHHIKEEAFRGAISRYIEEERKFIKQAVEELNKHLPFKNKL
jgi:predicted N-acyltransferase